MAAPAALTRDFLNLTPLQVKDLRSAVVREACATIKRLGALHPKQVAMAADELFESLMKLTYVTKEVRSASAPAVAAHQKAAPSNVFLARRPIVC